MNACDLFYIHALFQRIWSCPRGDNHLCPMPYVTILDALCCLLLSLPHQPGQRNLYIIPTIFSCIEEFVKIQGGSAVSTEWRCLTAVVLTPYLRCMGLGPTIRTTSASGERWCQGRRSRLSLRPGRNWDTGRRGCLFHKYNWLWMC